MSSCGSEVASFIVASSRSSRETSRVFAPATARCLCSRSHSPVSYTHLDVYKRQIYDREVVSELYSTSGEYDLIAKIYIPEDADVGHYLSERLFDIPGIVRTLTTMTFKAF